MALLGELAVNLIANTKKFESGMKRSKKSVTDFRRVTKLASSALSLFGVGLSAVAVVNFAKNQFTATEALGLTADKLDVNIERLQAYQFQASKAQISTTTLNTALQRMVRRVSEAAQGTGEAKNALKELGLDAQQLARMRTGDVYEQISRSFKGIGSQGDRVRLAMRLFDTEGVSLVNLFAEGVEKSRKEYEKLGVAATQQDFLKAQQINKEFAEAMVELTAAGRKFVIDVSPAVLETVRFLRRQAKLASERREGLASFGGAVGNFLSGGGSEGTLRQVQARERSLLQKLTAGGLQGGSTVIGPQETVSPATIQSLREAMGADRQVY